MNSQEKVVVTGGAGFIGSNLCDCLINTGNNVVCIDDLSTGSINNISHLLNNPNFKFLDHDVCEPWHVKCNKIYHLACPASPVHYQRDRVKTIKTAFIGTMRTLECAYNVGARVVVASTSEVYGDPDVHPQFEQYKGNVNPVGSRSCYDEGKRAAEALVYSWINQYPTDVRIARLFNSLTGDQYILYMKNGKLYYETFEECFLRNDGNSSGISVPSFDNHGNMIFRNISMIIRHHVMKPGMEVKTTWGRSVCITTDHSLFRVESDGCIKPVFGYDLSIGDQIVVPRHLSIDEVRLIPFRISDRVHTRLSVQSLAINTILNNKSILHRVMVASGISSRSCFSRIARMRNQNSMPIELMSSCKIPKTELDQISCFESHKFVNDVVTDIDNFLWFLGYTLADGCIVNSNGDYQICYSDKYQKYLDKVASIINSLFGIDVAQYLDDSNTPNLRIRSKILVDLLASFEFYSGRKQIPNWIIQLPADQISKFLHGFWCGDGNHDAKTTGEMIIFYSSEQKIIAGLNLLLMRLGHIGSILKFKTRARKNGPVLEAWRIYVCGIENANVESLHKVPSRNGNQFKKDIAFAKVKSIRYFDIDGFVYDFSVPDVENFFGGAFGIMCHNTYGQRMSVDDGRVVPNFICQAIRNEPITIYGDGLQTRSLCYISDMINGLMRLMEISRHDLSNEFIFNLGNPDERTILQIAQYISSLFPGRNIEYRNSLADDPRRRKPDITRAISILNWKPLISFEIGMIATLKYFKSKELL
jgi:UDP-glucuronate decarboxylase